VSELLAERGAIIVDADAIVREIQEPGSPVVRRLADEFGSHILTSDGALDRQAVAEIVFKDPDALKKLNAIVHPAVGEEMNRRVLEQRTTTNVVVLDIPLLTENPRDGLQGRIVVDVPEDVQVRRLVEHRGFTEDDARARMSRQASREDRLATADFVVDNSGTRDELVQRIDALWAWLTSLPQLPADYEPSPPRSARDPGNEPPGA
jgi:dephospho-CoA kinase